MTITVKDLIDHLEKIDPDTPVYSRATGGASGVYLMTPDDYAGKFFQGYIDLASEKGGKYEFDLMSVMESKRGLELTNKSAVKVLAL